MLISKKYKAEGLRAYVALLSPKKNFLFPKEGVPPSLGFSPLHLVFILTVISACGKTDQKKKADAFPDGPQLNSEAYVTASMFAKQSDLNILNDRVAAGETKLNDETTARLAREAELNAEIESIKVDITKLQNNLQTEIDERIREDANIRREYADADQKLSEDMTKKFNKLSTKLKTFGLDLTLSDEEIQSLHSLNALELRMSAALSSVDKQVRAKIDANDSDTRALIATSTSDTRALIAKNDSDTRALIATNKNLAEKAIVDLKSQLSFRIANLEAIQRIAQSNFLSTDQFVELGNLLALAGSAFSAIHGELLIENNAFKSCAPPKNCAEQFLDRVATIDQFPELKNFKQELLDSFTKSPSLMAKIQAHTQLNSLADELSSAIDDEYNEFVNTPSSADISISEILVKYFKSTVRFEILFSNYKIKMDSLVASSPITNRLISDVIEPRRIQMKSTLKAIETRLKDMKSLISDRNSMIEKEQADIAKMTASMTAMDTRIKSLDTALSQKISDLKSSTESQLQAVNSITENLSRAFSTFSESSTSQLKSLDSRQTQSESKLISLTSSLEQAKQDMEKRFGENQSNEDMKNSAQNLMSLVHGLHLEFFQSLQAVQATPDFYNKTFKDAITTYNAAQTDAKLRCQTDPNATFANAMGVDVMMFLAREYVYRILILNSSETWKNDSTLLKKFMNVIFDDPIDSPQQAISSNTASDLAAKVETVNELKKWQTDVDGAANGISKNVTDLKSFITTQGAQVNALEANVKTMASVLLKLTSRFAPDLVAEVESLNFPNDAAWLGKIKLQPEPSITQVQHYYGNTVYKLGMDSSEWKYNDGNPPPATCSSANINSAKVYAQLTFDPCWVNFRNSLIADNYTNSIDNVILRVFGSADFIHVKGYRNDGSTTPYYNKYINLLSDSQVLTSSGQSTIPIEFAKSKGSNDVNAYFEDGGSNERVQIRGSTTLGIFDIHGRASSNINGRTESLFDRSVLESLSGNSGVIFKLTPVRVTKRTLSQIYEYFESANISTYSVSLYSPLLLDFNSLGTMETLDQRALVQFDLDADGHVESTGWVDGSEGSFLALDLNHNGLIDNGQELFGEATRLPDGKQARHAYEALGQYDFNADGMIDKHDSIFSKLLVWSDHNRNGISENSELASLVDKNVNKISLKYEDVPMPKQFQAGNRLKYKARFFGPQQCPNEGCLSYDVYFGVTKNLSSK